MSDKDNHPFFILGSVRSGTTLLRDILRAHQRLTAPEETHFFRWAEPYGSNAYEQNYLYRDLFAEHRRRDGVTDFEFFYTLQHGCHRKHLMDHYARIYLENNQLEGLRWFDKTPQNVYGLLLISANYPESRFVHIHRHPFNVVASLRLGRSLPPQPLSAAINYWLESAQIINEYRRGFPDRVYEIPYERLCQQPLETINGLLEFLGEPPFGQIPEEVSIGCEQNRYREVLDEEDLQTIRDCCADMMQVYGYD